MRLITWDAFQFKVNSDRLAPMLLERIAEQKAPIDDVRLTFEDGALTVNGRLRKGLSVPFRVVIRRIEPAGRMVRVRLDEVSAFGFPVPQFLFSVFESKLSSDVMFYEPAQRAFLIRLERILPTSLDVAIDSIRIVRDGVLVHLGTGGADLPTAEGSDGRQANG